MQISKVKRFKGLRCMAKKKTKSKIDWIKIKNDYVFNNLTIRELVKKYGVAQSSIGTHCSKENWEKTRQEERNKIETETAQKIRDREIARRVAKNEEHIRLYDDGLDVVKSLLRVYQEQASELKRRGNVNPFNLEKIFSCIEKAQKGQRLALNIDKEEITEKEPQVFVVNNLDLDKI